MEMGECGLSAENIESPVQVFNACVGRLADAINKPRIEPLESQVAFLENCCKAKRSAVGQKAEEACQLLFCDVIAPNDGKQLFQEIVSQHQSKSGTGDAGLQALVVAYQNAPSKSLKTQILSIFAARFTTKEL